MSLSHPTSSHPTSPPRKVAKKDEAGLYTRMTEQQEEYATATTLPPVMPELMSDEFSSLSFCELHPTSSHPTSPPRKMAKKDAAGLNTRMAEQEKYATATTLQPVMPTRDDVFSSIELVSDEFSSLSFGDLCAAGRTLVRAVHLRKEYMDHLQRRPFEDVLLRSP